MLSYTTMRTVSDLPSLLPASFPSSPNANWPKQTLAWELLSLSLTGIPYTYILSSSQKNIKKQRHYFVNKGPSGQGYGFSSGHV